MCISTIRSLNLNLKIDFETDTIDEFCRGNFFLVQPKKVGHRSGLDAMLLASCVPNNFKGKFADFGSGAGAAALAVLTRCLDATATLVENSDCMIEYAKKTLMLRQNQHLVNRVNIIKADISANGKCRIASNLLENYFDYIIMNPPYNNPASNQSSHQLRTLAHVKTENLFEFWLKTAACSLKSKGHLAIIAKSCSLHEILQACGKRFGNIKIYPIYPHKNASSLRIIIIAQKNSRAPTLIKSPIYIRELDENNNLKLTQQLINITNALNYIED